MNMRSLITVLAMATATTVALGQSLPPAYGRGGRAAGILQRREAAIEKREANQQRRIEQGIKHGQLTPAEVDKLEGLENNIKAMEARFLSDGKLSKDEMQQLRKALHDTSLQIWAERHDTEGNQMAVLRLGKNVFANDTLTGAIESGSMSGVQAREFLRDLRMLVTIKRRLSAENLTADQRARLQAEYNELLNKYFVVR